MASVTNPSLIRPILDYIFKATEGDCEIVITDGPIESASFIKTAEALGLYKTVDYVQKIYKKKMKIKILNLRDYILEKRGSIKFLSVMFHLFRKKVLRSPEEYFTIDLKEFSEFESISDQLQELVSTTTEKVPSFAQSKGHHLYTITKELLDADVRESTPAFCNEKWKVNH